MHSPSLFLVCKDSQVEFWYTWDLLTIHVLDTEIGTSTNVWQNFQFFMPHLTQKITLDFMMIFH